MIALLVVLQLANYHNGRMISMLLSIFIFLVSIIFLLFVIWSYVKQRYLLKEIDQIWYKPHGQWWVLFMSNRLVYALKTYISCYRMLFLNNSKNKNLLVIGWKRPDTSSSRSKVDNQFPIGKWRFSSTGVFV